MSADADAAAGVCLLSPSFQRSLDELLANVDFLVDRTRAVQDEDLPAYDAVPRDLIHESVCMNLMAVRDALLSGRVRLTQRDIATLDNRLVIRGKLGLQIQDIVQGSRTSIGVIQKRFVEIATANGVPLEEILDATGKLWTLGDAIAVHLAVSWQHMSVDHAVREAHRRTEFLRDVLSASLDADDWEARVSTFGLNPSAEYRAIKARATGTAPLEVLERRLAETPNSVVGTIGGVCVGVLSRVPRPFDNSAIAVGPVVPLGHLSSSFEVAARLLEWMTRRDLDGMFELGETTWRLAVDREDDVTRLLMDRYLAPVWKQGDFGELLHKTLDAFVRNNMNVTRAARELIVHPNTLRYRLTRYSDLTGIDLESPNALIELSWALEGLRGMGGAPPAARVGAAPAHCASWTFVQGAT